jgi:hypothetical protein
VRTAVNLGLISAAGEIRQRTPESYQFHNPNAGICLTKQLN